MRGNLQVINSMMSLACVCIRVPVLCSRSSGRFGHQGFQFTSLRTLCLDFHGSELLGIVVIAAATATLHCQRYLRRRLSHGGSCEDPLYLQPNYRKIFAEGSFDG
mmetsp:Transcript_63565/g.125199  ORF Transcript_63565/g.125199 Transcript_63565/m.125199 type:complete len:105 (+) Transcript_63565:214-528(+)